MQRTQAIAILVCIAPFAPETAWALGPRKAMYVGGTVSSLPGRAEGNVDITAAAAMFFVAEKSGSTLAVPWRSIQDLEYGPRVSPRWKTAKSLTSLLSRGRKRYVTITYKDSTGAEQAAVFEFGSEIVRRTLTALKAKSGKPLACQDEEAAREMGDICNSVLPPEKEEEKK